MRILITGISGLLGAGLVRVFSGSEDEISAVDIIEPSYVLNGIDFELLDITDPEKTYREVTKKNPDIIIHAAAFTDVDRCESETGKAFAVNTLGTRNLALACQRFDTPLVYVSTDYVFDGRKGSPYSEYDRPNPLGVYAQTKYWGEVHVTQLLNKYFIVRTSWLFGSSGQCFPKSILARAREKEPLKVVDDQTGSPTYADDLACSIRELISRTPALFGIYHVTNGGSCTWYEFSRAILDEAVRAGYIDDYSVTRQGTEDLARPAPRPGFSVLDNFFWKNNGFEPLRPWRDTLGPFIKEMKSKEGV